MSEVRGKMIKADLSAVVDGFGQNIAQLCWTCTRVDVNSVRCKTNTKFANPKPHNGPRAMLEVGQLILEERGSSSIFKIDLACESARSSDMCKVCRKWRRREIAVGCSVSCLRALNARTCTPAVSTREHARYLMEAIARLFKA